MKKTVSPLTGNTIAGILIPAAIIIPLTLGWLWIVAIQKGIIKSESDIFILIGGIIVVQLALTMYCIRVLNRNDLLRREAEQALQKSRELFYDLIDTAPDAVVIVNEKGNIQIFNNQATALFGYSKEEIKGQPVEVLLPDSKKSIHQQHRQQYMSQPRVRPMGAGLELEARKKDGITIPVEISLSPLQTDEGMMISASIRDITERRTTERRLKQFNEELEKQVAIKTSEILETEKRFRTLMDRISEGFLALDKNWRYTYVNKEVGRMTNRDPQSLIGKNVWEEFPDAVGTATYKSFIRAMKEQTYIQSVDYYPPLDLWQENHIYPSPDGLSVFIRDITERKKAEEEMKRTNEELRRLSIHLQTIREEERISFAREIHDDLGQQLTGLKMYLYSLQKNPPASELEFSEKMNEIVQLTDNIITSIRRISANLRPPALDDLGLEAALEWLSGEIMKRTGIPVQFNAEPFLLELPIRHATGLFRIYQEALNNAVKHSGATRIEGRLHIQGEHLVLEISDNGKGMDLTARPSQKSFGLLSMKERCYMMNGIFDLHSEPGKGTHIRVSVSLADIID
jgi:PAS domain S-box-containing protein